MTAKTSTTCCPAKVDLADGWKTIRQRLVVIDNQDWRDKLPKKKTQISDVTVSGVKKCFQCELCMVRFFNQIEFYYHLQTHYQPELAALANEIDEDKETQPLLKEFVSKKKRSRVKENETTFLPVKQEIVESEPEVVQPLKDTGNGLKITRSGRISKPKRRDDEVINLSPKIEKSVANSETEFDENDGEDVLQDFLDELIEAEHDDDWTPTEKADTPNEAKEVVKSPKKQNREEKSRVAKPRKRKNGKFSDGFKTVQIADNGPLKYECPICLKLYAQCSSMKTHLLIHKGEKPYQCTMCGTCFRRQADLQYHTTSIHSTLKAHQCDYCGKEFSRKYSLTVHRRIHTGIRDYKCDLCPMAFRASNYLVEHKRIHTGEKPYACDICTQRFRISSDMKRHRANVHFKGSISAAESATRKIVAPPIPKTLRKSSKKKREESASSSETENDEEIVEEIVQEEDESDKVPSRKLVFLSETEAIYL